MRDGRHPRDVVDHQPLDALDPLLQHFLVVGEAKFIIITGRCELADQDVGAQQSDAGPWPESGEQQAIGVRNALWRTVVDNRMRAGLPIQGDNNLPELRLPAVPLQARSALPPAATPSAMCGAPRSGPSRQRPAS